MKKKTTVDTVLARIAGSGSRLISLLSGLLAAFLILYSGYVLYDTFYTQNQAYASGWDVLQYRPEIIEEGTVPLAGGETLIKINKDYRAWLTLYDTNIDYPLMQGADDLYYASHDVHGKSSLTGAIYLAAANSGDLSDNYNLIYGHHMDNAAMFGGLDYYTAKDYFDAHREGLLVGTDSLYDMTVFAVVLTNAYEGQVYTTGERDLAALLSFIEENALIFDETAAAGAEKIAALSTCADTGTDGRTVVFAVLRERTQEEDSVDPAVPVTPVDPDTPDTPAGPDNPDAPVDPEDPQATVRPMGPEEIVIVDDPVEMKEQETPLARFTKPFIPTGSAFGTNAWALVNLVCVILTVYMLLPLLHLKDKFRRASLMDRVNEAQEMYDAKRFKRRFRIGLVLELLVCAAAVILFIFTEDMSQPMVLIDRYTPLMLILLVLCWFVDVRLARYREGREEMPAAAAAVPAQAD